MNATLEIKTRSGIPERFLFLREAYLQSGSDAAALLRAWPTGFPQEAALPALQFTAL